MFKILSFILFLFQITVYAQDAIERYPNGVTKVSGFTNDNLKDSVWYYYYPSGNVMAVEHFKKGRLHGVAKYYFDATSSPLQGEEKWINGNQEDSAKHFYSNGIIEKKGVYHHSQYDGLWIYYHDNGKVERTVNYENGLPNGIVKIFNDQGVLSQEGFYKDGREHGQWKFYNQEGKLEYSGSYINGERSGDWFRYDKKGNPRKWKH